MLRRRLLGAFDFGVKLPNESKYNKSILLNYVYGIQKDIITKEVGIVVGNNVTYTTKNNKHYYKLSGLGEGTVNVAFLNFTTDTANQLVSINIICDSKSTEDFIGICKLDNVDDKNHLIAKYTGATTEQTVNITVPKAGSHFVKIYYYQHNDGSTSGTNSGYFSLVSYDHTYKYGYNKPNSQQIKIRSYNGWVLTNKSEWISLDPNITSYKPGYIILNVNVLGNHGLKRTGIIEFTERHTGKIVTVNIDQDANIHPNDILLTLNNGGLPVDITENDSDTKTMSVNVKLIGDTDYDVYNPNGTYYSFSKTSIENVSGGEYTDMSVKQNTLTIKKTNKNEINPINFTISGKNNGINKSITINSDKILCYCDCNQYNRCGCHIEENKYKQEFSGCSPHSYNCSSHTANANNCPSHCSSKTGYVACSAHSSCISVNTCNCYQYTACKCENEKKCPSYVACSCDTNRCNKSACTCETQKQCPSYVACSCDTEKQCPSYVACSCDTEKQCPSYVACSDTWVGGQLNDVKLRIFPYCTGANSNITMVAQPILIKIQPVKKDGNGTTTTLDECTVWGMTSGNNMLNYKGQTGAMNSSEYWEISLPSICAGAKLREIVIWEAQGYGNKGYHKAYRATSFPALSSSTKPDNTGTDYFSGCYDARGIGLAFLNYTSSVQFQIYPTGDSEITTYSVSNNNQCPSNDKLCNYSACSCETNRCSKSGCSCETNRCSKSGCSCETNKCSKSGCTCETEKDCPTKVACSCETNKCDKTACNCKTQNLCTSKRTDCTCYTKLYYTYCKCEGYCKCHNYDIPTTDNNFQPINCGSKTPSHCTSDFN